MHLVCIVPFASADWSTALTDHGIESFTRTAYYEFAVSFLTQPELVLFESNIATFAAVVDVDRLSDSLSTGITPDPKASESQAGLMWLLSHFIILQKTRKQLVLHSRSLRVLYALLSALSTQIRAGFEASALKASGDVRDLDEVPSDIEEVPQPALPPYVLDKLASLTDRDEISGLLEKFTS
jgi:ubiquitin-protein ligase E3 C